ncbi:MAG: hypothetical protein AB1601_08805 [Planctomycetota bacterium]
MRTCDRVPLCERPHVVSLSPRACAATAVATVLWLTLGGVPANAFLINKDVKQTFVDPQDNYEVVLAGDWRAATGFINPFLNGSVQKSYDGQNTTVSFAGDPIPKGNNWHHFGFGSGIFQDHSKIKAEYWTRGTAASKTPGASTGYNYNPGAGTMQVTFGNDTQDPVRLVDSFFDVFVELPALEMLNRQHMPPGSGSPTGVTPMILYPGQSVQFEIPNVLPTDGVVTFVEVAFLQPDPGGYEDTVGIWTGIPEPASFSLLGLAGALLMRRR